MSMLAERRQKTRFIIHPTKKPFWKTDEKGMKFGKQLMEKMGWTAGKGLGLKEQGISEPIRIGYKNDTKGMGFKENDDNWIQNQEEFNFLLNSLKGASADETLTMKEETLGKVVIESLEEKSKKSKARVHYQKFTRGKDLARYSEEDLACILGNKKKKKCLEEDSEVVTKSEESSEKENSFGVTTVNGGSLADYFKRKWKNLDKTALEHTCSELETSEQVPAEIEIDVKRKSKKKRKKDNELKEETEQEEYKEEALVAKDPVRLKESMMEGEKREKKKKRKNVFNCEDEKEFKRSKNVAVDGQPSTITLENSCFISIIGSERESTVKTEQTGYEEGTGQEKPGPSKDYDVTRAKKSKKKNRKEKKEKTLESNGLENLLETQQSKNRLEMDENAKEIDLNKKLPVTSSFSCVKSESTKKFSQSRILNLVCDVRLDKFKGSNLEKVSGYGAPKPKR